MDRSNNGFLQALIRYGYVMIFIYIMYCGIKGVVLLLYPNDNPKKVKFRTNLGMWVWLLGCLLYVVILGNIVPYDYFEAIVGWPVIVITLVTIVIGNFICASRNNY